MQDNPRYADVVLEVLDSLEARIEAAGAAGIPRAGSPSTRASASARRWRTTWRCSRTPRLLHGLGVPLLIGASRKRFIRRHRRRRGAGA